MPALRHFPVLLLVVLVTAFFTASAHAQTSPPTRSPASTPLRVLFLGNSLTASNDLPALVQAMARQQNIAFEYEAVLRANYAIEDHWNDRMARVLNARKWDVLVLQQGPSSRPDSRAELLRWSKTWADEARKTGTQTALYMVWPVKNQPDGFALVTRSYREAATGSKARILPAGEAWAAFLAATANATPLYSPDGLHPTPAGTFLAAMVIARGLTGLDLSRVPASLTLASGEVIALPATTVAAFRTAVAKLVFD